MQTLGGAAAVRKSGAYVVRKCHRDLLRKRKKWAPLLFIVFTRGVRGPLRQKCLMQRRYFGKLNDLGAGNE